jgi:hypothetical protein
MAAISKKNIDHEKYIQLLKDIMDNELSNYAIESTRNYYEGDIWEYENGRDEKIKEEQRNIETHTIFFNGYLLLVLS